MKIYETIELLNNISFNLLWKWKKLLRLAEILLEVFL